jgi:hypothetical protein
VQATVRTSKRGRTHSGHLSCGLGDGTTFQHHALCTRPSPHSKPWRVSCTVFPPQAQALHSTTCSCSRPHHPPPAGWTGPHPHHPPPLEQQQLGQQQQQEEEEEGRHRPLLSRQLLPLLLCWRGVPWHLGVLLARPSQAQWRCCWQRRYRRGMVAGQGEQQQQQGVGGRRWRQQPSCWATWWQRPR